MTLLGGTSLVMNPSGLVAQGFTELGQADVTNSAGSVDSFTLPYFDGDGSPTITVATPAVAEAGNITVGGTDATDLFIAGFALTQIAAATVTNLVSATIATAVTALDMIECVLSVRSGLVLNVYRLLFVGNGAALFVYCKKEL